MSTIYRTYQSRIAVPARELFDWHSRPGAFERLTPPWAYVELVDFQGAISPGDWKTLRITAIGPIRKSWKLVHRQGDTPLGFTDVQEFGPFASWRHVHRFIPDGDSNAILEDELAFEPPYGSAGAWMLEGRIEDQLDTLFLYRHRRTQHDVERHFHAAIPRPSRIAVTGSSGLVGRRLVPFLRAGGHQVLSLVRRQPQSRDEVFWNPDTGEIDKAALEGIDAVIHLAGVSIAGGRWTSSRKQAIERSRVLGTRLLAETLASLTVKPEVLVSTSAVGFYGNGGDAVLTEASPRGSGFLASVCEAWEAAAIPASDAGIRVVHPRVGVVMAAEGGMLPVLSRVFKFGVGGPLGNGDQYLSWIALDDLLGVLLESLSNRELRGPVNAVSPQPRTNREFSSTLAGILHRPNVVRTPAFAMRLAAGQMADELILASQRVQPVRLQEQGFSFTVPDLEQALRHEYGKYEKPRAALPERTAAADHAAV